MSPPLPTAPWLWPLALAAACPAWSGCIEPLVDDEVQRPELVLPAGSVLPLLTDDEAMRAQIDRNDGLDADRVLLRSGFAGGERVYYWDMGPASPAPIPLYTLVIKDEAGLLETPQGRYNLVGQPSVFDAVPGDPGYSPWWTLVLWPITDRYRGEVLTSFEAFDEALRQGLVEPSITLPLALNCPVVLPEARLQLEPDDSVPDMEPFKGYYRGKVVTYFAFDVAFMATSTVGTPPQYVLRHEGGEPLSEPVRGVDLTRDGDVIDTNDVFAAPFGDLAYTGMVEVVDVVVHDAELIDESGADDDSDVMSAADLFTDGAPDPERVVAVYPTGLVLNRPLKHAPLVPP